MNRNLLNKLAEPEARLIIIRALFMILGGIIIIRLFYLQVIRNDYYQRIATKEHYGYSELPARRGEIFIKDYASGEQIRVATNIALDTLYADPTIIKNPKIVADRISPLIFNLDEQRELDNERIKTEKKRANTLEALNAIKALTDEQLYQNYYNDLLNKISQKIRTDIVLNDEMSPEAINQIKTLNLPGIEIKDTTVIAHPTQIQDKETRTLIAAKLSKYVDISHARLEDLLVGKNRYVILQKKIKPEVTSQIRKILNDDKEKNFYGLGLSEEYYRYYPEETLAANVLGFVTPQGQGQYGIESKYNQQLQGKKGIFETQRDGSVYGRQITVGDSVIQPAEDGSSIVLTLDRSIEMTVEAKLKKAVEDYKAESGQVIVMDPKTGNIMAMANYPNFNPNDYSSAGELEEMALTPEQVANLVPVDNQPDQFYYYRNPLIDDKFLIFRQKLENGQYIYKRYKNWIGIEAYQNKTVTSPYEPGSVFKTIAMASAIDDKDVTPKTAFNDPGVVYLDKNKNGKHTGPDGEKYDSKISNVSAKCTGFVTMSDVIAYSCNTGMTFVSKKMGRNLFYSYMLRFGFNERTEIEFDNESPGKITHFSTWADSDLATHAFGQGILVTPLQIATAYGAIANKGVLMQPHIVDKVIQSDGKVIQSEVTPIQRVVSEDTASTITAMLVNAVENGVAKAASLPNHYIAGKTGTAQTYKHGMPLNGAGTTITSLAGFGPIEDPKFVLYVKLDRPQNSEWSEANAVYLFKDIAGYLYDYLGIPPDKK